MGLDVGDPVDAAAVAVDGGSSAVVAAVEVGALGALGAGDEAADGLELATPGDVVVHLLAAGGAAGEAAVVLALTLYNGSVIAELVRSGVYSLPKGQGEAGLSIGLTPSQVLRSIQLPQALTAMLPALIGQFVVVLKDSALGTAITYQELLTWGKTLGSAYGNTVPAYIVVAIIFIILNYLMTRLATAVQHWLARRGTTAGPLTTAQPVLIQGGAEPGEITHTGTDIVREGAQEVREAASKARDNRRDPGW